MPSILVQGAALKNAAEIFFFFFFVTTPSGAVARCEDRPIFSAAARAGGGASSAGSVAGLLSFRVLAFRRLFVGGVECGYACLQFFHALRDSITRVHICMYVLACGHV